MTSFDTATKVVLIGGGDLLAHAEHCARQVGYETGVVASPRHIDEPLLAEESSLRDWLKRGDAEVHVVDDINAWPGLPDLVGTGPALAMGFGPAWIFSRQTRSAFRAGMINFHGIPIPHYIGGAHATWQILNADRSGGCIIQKIEDRIDRGAILRREYFDIPAHMRTPIEYQTEVIVRGKAFLERFFADAASGVAFEAQPFAELEPDRLYLPRLYTPAQAFIDWNWNARHVERFICAFDEPYPGARTFLDDTPVILRSAYIDTAMADMHPFAAGLIVRRQEGQVWVAAHEGVIRVERTTLSDGSDAYDVLKEGTRLRTPAAVLEDAKRGGWTLTPQGFHKTVTPDK